MLQMKYVAFISYSHSDSKVAKRLHRWLEGYSIPKRLIGKEIGAGTVPRKLRPIFRDREELPTSADLGQQITSALQNSTNLIVICSPKAAASKWVNEEILSYKRLERPDRILCLIVDGEPNATEKPEIPAEECFPPAIRYQLAADGSLSSTPAEPIAADMRRGKDGRRDAWLKIAAGIAGVGFDELKQRELRRQLRRAIVVSTIASILLIAMIGLTVIAVLSRREALFQQEIAVAERDRAEQNFRDARDAVDQFYTKVSEDQLLKAEGLQTLRAELLGEALEYYRRFLSQRKDDPAFALEAAIVQGNVGGILSDVGDPEDALKSTRQAATALEQLFRKSPNNPLVVNKLSETLGNEAVALDKLGRNEESLVAHKRALALFDTLPRDSHEWSLAELQRLLSIQGAFEAKTGQLQAAVISYEKSLEAAAQIKPEIARLGVALELAHDGLAVIAVQQYSPAAEADIQIGDILTSINEVPLTKLSDMAAIQPTIQVGKELNASVSRKGESIELLLKPVHLGDFPTAITQYNLGVLYLERLGVPEKAKPWLIKSVDEYKRTLLRETAATPDVRAGLAAAAGSLATCGYRLDDLPLWQRGERDSIHAAKENVQNNPAVPSYRTGLAIQLANSSVLLMQQGDLERAETNCLEAVEQLQVALNIGGNLKSDRFQLIRVLQNLAIIISDLRGAEASIPIYDAALNAAKDLVNTDSLPQALSLALAQLHRNRASSLRRTNQLENALSAYNLAHKYYKQARATFEAAPAWLVKEQATTECWRAALLFGLNENGAASKSMNLYESYCTSLRNDFHHSRALVDTRYTAITALTDIAIRLLPGNLLLSERIIEAAKKQLLRLKAFDIHTSDSTIKKQLIDESTALINGYRLRAQFGSDEQASAWRLLSEFLDSEQINLLAFETRLDLAASLLMAGTDISNRHAIVFDSIHNDLKTTPHLLLRVQEWKKVAQSCGISTNVISQLDKLLQ